ncbi:MAG: DUF3465 domain-containing protein [Xanthomonadales bacterium]|nr:DUF3465 domain-containing protein [Xanthomonadales bacterium]
MRINPKTNSRLRNLIFVFVIAWFGWQYFQDNNNTGIEPSESRGTNNQVLLEAVRQRRSDVWLVAVGEVKHVLKDDNVGSRHQRFILNIEPGLTVLVAHNIDLAERVPLRQGDSIRLRGEYEWTEKGGVLHWTHHDPKGRREGGWIEHKNRRYE